MTKKPKSRDEIIQVIAPKPLDPSKPIPEPIEPRSKGARTRRARPTYRPATPEELRAAGQPTRSADVQPNDADEQADAEPSRDRTSRRA